MSRLYPTIAKMFLNAGFDLVRNGKGSHRIFRKGNTVAVISTNIAERNDANRRLKKAGIEAHL
jgi:predicted RNA binding protein YcfA (HicA-like mRNA interferase family)